MIIAPTNTLEPNSLVNKLQKRLNKNGSKTIPVGPKPVKGTTMAVLSRFKAS